ncbi:hypothetical protein EDC61_10170 [Sulfuritortus calidifontis]|uniref:Uncharacterized protein n=1 Tax=Sulfuritortus calidifontis TaxID=1914471 RepID=A0A4R3JYJ7_9PROT|nr:hypothetical protein [Sulfuritortus calidifontis]TCS73848.1 hypothetical protein EDC61_10170 [Sulfuritortus calidifontis]
MTLRLIDSREALAALVAQPPGSQGNPLSKVRFALSHLPDEENDRLSKQCNRLIIACGCGAGAATAIAAAGVYAAVATHSDWGAEYSPWAHLVLGAAAFFFCGLTGKLIGLAISRHRLRKLLLQALDQTEKYAPAALSDVPTAHP